MKKQHGPSHAAKPAAVAAPAKPAAAPPAAAPVVDAHADLKAAHARLQKAHDDRAQELEKTAAEREHHRESRDLWRRRHELEAAAKRETDAKLAAAHAVVEAVKAFRGDIERGGMVKLDSPSWRALCALLDAK